MVVTRTPHDLLYTPLDRRELQLPPSTVDPFVDDYALVEVYFVGVMFDVVASKVGLLFDLASTVPSEPTVSVALLVCEGISEFGWKVDVWGRRQAPSWWTVLQHGFLPADAMLPRVAIAALPQMAGGPAPPIPGFERESRYRYSFGLSPSSEIIVAFNSAVCFEGSQAATPNAARVSFCAEAEWHGICSWPRG